MRAPSLIVTLILAVGLPAFAHEGVTNPTVMIRMQGMSAMAEASKVLGQMAKGERAFDPEITRAAAETLARHAGEIPARFETQAQDPKSEALPAIWSRFAAFTAEAEALEVAARRAVGADSQAALGAALTDIGTACKSCHAAYRK
jgi:cytochrome c556